MKVLLLLIKILLLFCSSYSSVCNQTVLDDFASTLHLDAEHTLYLMQSYCKQHQILNNKFIKFANQLGFTVREVPDFCPIDGVEATAIVNNDYNVQNVINLKVVNKYTDNEVSNKNLAYVGYADEYLSTIECTGDDKECIAKEEITEYDEKTCIDQFKQFGAIKLVSKSVKEYTLLHKVIADLSVDDSLETKPYWNKYVKISKELTKEPFKQFNVIICLDDTDVNITKYKAKITKAYKDISIRYVKDCIIINDYVEYKPLAVLTSKPFYLEDKTDVPVLFFGIPYLMPEHKDVYTNSISIHDNHMPALAHALVKFLTLTKWKRIAVVSDDSPYSEAFEIELTKLFKQKGIIYVAKQCLKRNCEFKKILKSLREAKATIIIANVGEKYGKLLAKTARVTHMTSPQGFIWIWRDWPFRDDDGLKSVEAMGDVISIYLSTSLLKFQDLGQDIIKDQNLITIGNIVEAISVINVAAFSMRMSVKYEERKFAYNKEFHRYVSQTIQSVVKSRHGVVVYVRNISSKGQNQFLCAMNYFRGTAKFIRISETFNFTVLPADLQDCNYRSYKFHAPCDDIYLLLEMMVLLMFMFAILAINIFFYKFPGTNYATL